MSERVGFLKSIWELSFNEIIVLLIALIVGFGGSVTIQKLAGTSTDFGYVIHTLAGLAVAVAVRYLLPIVKFHDAFYAWSRIYVELEIKKNTPESAFVVHHLEAFRRSYGRLVGSGIQLNGPEVNEINRACFRSFRKSAYYSVVPTTLTQYISDYPQFNVALQTELLESETTVRIIVCERDVLLAEARDPAKRKAIEELFRITRHIHWLRVDPVLFEGVRNGLDPYTFGLWSSCAVMRYAKETNGKDRISLLRNDQASGLYSEYVTLTKQAIVNAQFMEWNGACGGLTFRDDRERLQGLLDKLS